jgi:hypothetical protein
MYIIAPVNLLFGLVLALIMTLGSFDVNAGINEKPPVLISMLPVWACAHIADEKKNRAVRYCFILIH